MKKFLGLLLVIMLVLSFVACSADEGGDDSAAKGISFKLDGISVSYGHSFLEPEYGDEPFGNCDDTGNGVDITDDSIIFAQPVATYLSNGQPDAYVILIFENVTNSSGAFLSATNGEFDYRKDGNSYDVEAFSLTITEFGAIGESIKGTFTATVSYGGVTNEITDGVIDVVRISNATFTF